jgi:GH35 family endo-1,4-beta-xylanase
VVNEALNDDGTCASRRAEILGEITGEGLPAHEADPQAELYYNDY